MKFITGVRSSCVYVRVCVCFVISRSQSLSGTHFHNVATADMHQRMEVYAKRSIRLIYLYYAPPLIN